MYSPDIIDLRYTGLNLKGVCVLVDYKDRETGEVFELFFKNRSEVTDTVVNEKTGNLSDKQMASGSFKFAGVPWNSGPMM